MLDDVYQDCSKRVIIIDQEGVIPMKTNHGKLEPTVEAIQALSLIADDPNNIVFVVSTESKSLMHKWYHEKAPSLGLAAENGFFWRWTSKNMGEDEWINLVEVEDL